MENELIRIHNISKTFGDNKVLNDISLSIKRGEVCCILGENGAGKTTLMKMLAGIYLEDVGSIYFEGHKILIDSPEVAQSLGIRMIFQESYLVPGLTVTDNIFLNNELDYKKIPFLNKTLMDKKAKDVLDMMKSDIDVRSKVKNLTPAQRKLVEIARALVFDTKLIILDEPTSSMMDTEVQDLFDIIRKLKSMGVAVVYISHSIEEVNQIADQIIIMRNGEIVDVRNRDKEMNAGYFVEKMAGEDFVNRYPKTKACKGDIVFRAENISNSKGTVKNVSFYMRSGEIVGLTGLQGAGKTSVARLIYGFEKMILGKLSINDKEATIKEPHQAAGCGITYLGENISSNIFLYENTPYNLTISNLKRVSKRFFLDNQLIKNISRGYIKKLYLKVPYLDGPVKNLSRGTLQKLALAKLLFTDSKIFIMDEPSKELDIPSKVELYNIMNQMVRKGMSILLISSDTAELTGMCDRVYVMVNGSIVKEIDSKDLSSANIIYYATGEKD